VLVETRIIVPQSSSNANKYLTIHICTQHSSTPAGIIAHVHDRPSSDTFTARQQHELSLHHRALNRLLSNSHSITAAPANTLVNWVQTVIQMAFRIAASQSAHQLFCIWLTRIEVLQCIAWGHSQCTGQNDKWQKITRMTLNFKFLNVKFKF